MMITSIDANVVYKLFKGYVGCGILPAILACFSQVGPIDDCAEALTSLVVGYKIGKSFGIAIHRSVYDFHISGKRVAVAWEGVAARIHKLIHRSWSMR